MAMPELRAGDHMPLYPAQFVGVSVAGSLTTTGDASVGGSLAVTSNALGTAQPAVHGFAAWTSDPPGNTNSAVLTGGTVYLSALYIAKAVSITKIYWHVVTAGVTPTANQNVVGIYNSAGTLLQSAVVDSDISSTGLKTTTITSQALTAGSMYWVGFVFNAATIPAIVRATGVTNGSQLVNAGIASAASYRGATNGTSQTTLPASITPGSNSQGLLYWAAVSV